MKFEYLIKGSKILFLSIFLSLFSNTTYISNISKETTNVSREIQHVSLREDPDFGGPSRRDLHNLALSVDEVRYAGDWHGTGFAVVMDRKLKLLTAAHVVETNHRSFGPDMAYAAVVEALGCSWGLESVGEPIADVAMYGIIPEVGKPQPAGLPFAKSDPMLKGWVYTIGYPRGGFSVSRGVVLADGVGSYFALGGSSGAPILVWRNSQFQVCGVHNSGEHEHVGSRTLRLPVSYYATLTKLKKALPIE